MADRYEAVLENYEHTAWPMRGYMVVDNDVGYVVCRCNVQPTGSPPYELNPSSKELAEHIASLLNSDPYP